MENFTSIFEKKLGAKTTKYLILFGLVCLIFCSYLIKQQAIDYNCEIPYDGKQYLKATSYFLGDVPEYSVTYPYNSRIGIPYICSFLDDVQPITSFMIINFVSLIFFFWLLIIFLKTYGEASFKNISLIVLWISFHVMGPVRYYLHDPASVDLPAMVLEAFIVLSFLKRWNALLVITALMSILVKESIIPLLITLSAASIFFHQRRSLIVLISTLISVIAIKWVVSSYFPMAIEYWTHHSTLTLYYNFRRVLSNPIEILRWLTSFVFVGSLFLVKIRTIKNLNQDQKTVLLMALYGLCIAQVGGNDYSRLQFFSGILIFTALSIFMGKLTKLEFIFLTAGSIPFLRLFTILPAKHSYKSFPEYFDATTCCYWLGYFLLVLIFYYTSVYLKKRKSLRA